MDFTIDNNKTSEIDNATQALLMNANTDTKHEMDETNNIFGVTGDHHHLNDKMNNIIDQHNIGNDFPDVVSGAGGDANNLNVIENKEPSAMFEKACLDNEADMGPETSVDTTDDADNDTETYECSTLSHSKETLPSDNLLDSKFVLQGLDFDDKPGSLASPTTDMPFDGLGHSNDDQIHEEQNILYIAGLPDFENQCLDYNAKHDESTLGEDLSKTEPATQEVTESVAMSFEYNSDKVTDQDLFDNIKSEVNEIADRLESINVGCETSGLPSNKDDLAYNQFTEYIEHGAATNEQEVHGDHFGMLHQESLVRPPVSLQLKFNGSEELMHSSFLDTPASISPAPESPAIDTPPSASPAPVSPAPNANSGRLTPSVEEVLHLEDKLHGFDQPNFELGNHGEGELVEEVKQNEGNIEIDIDESSEHEKYEDEPRELEKNVQASHVQEKNEESHYAFTEHLEEVPEHQEDTDKQVEYEKYAAETNAIESPSAFGDSEYKKDFDELAAIQGNAYDFTNSINRDGDYAHNKHITDNAHFDEPLLETSESITVKGKTETIDEKRQDDGDELLEKMSVDVQVSLAKRFENELKEDLAESISEPEPLHESLVETLQMIEHVSEKLSTTIDDNILVSQMTSHDIDEVKEDMLPSLEIHEQRVESMGMMEDKLQIEHKETDQTQLVTKESDSSTNQEACAESLDESITTASKADEKPVAAAAATLENIIESEEIVPEIESQQTVELNSKEPQGDRTSDICVTEQSEENAEKLISDSLDKEVEDMTSRLNPEAKEFVPSSPPVASFDAKGNLFGSLERVGDDVISQSPQKGAFSLEDIIVPAEKDFEDEIQERPAGICVPVPHIPVGIPQQLVTCLNGDDLVSQSPQKGAPAMNDFLLPTSSQFEEEVISRPSELSSAFDAPESMNLKEAMHKPEKEQISPMDQTNSTLDDSMEIISPEGNLFGKIEDVMNSVQLLPNDDEEDEGIKTNGSLLPDANTNGDVPLINDITNLKLEDPNIVAEVIGMKAKVEKATKAPEIKKTEVKAKTSSTGPKKAVSSTSATISDSSKTKTPATVSKTKVSAGLTARPRTAPAPSSKPSSTEKKSTNVISARAKPDTKSSPVGVKKLPQTKPKTEESKTAVRQVASKVASSATRNPATSRTASTTSTSTATATKRASTVSTTNSTATKATAGPRPALSPSSKSTTLTSTHKPAISPRSTVTSTLRKTEALKSPTSAPPKTAAAKPALSSSSTASKTLSRTSAGGSTSATKTTTTTTTTVKKSTLSSTTKTATGTTTAAKKPVGVKKPLGSAAAAAAKQKTAASPTKPAAGETEETEIKMNGTSACAPAITVNGDSKD